MTSKRWSYSSQWVGGEDRELIYLASASDTYCILAGSNVCCSWLANTTCSLAASRRCSTERRMSDIGQTYHALWASLLPQSNRQTGFSLRSPTRRSYVEFCRVGFCFRYRLEYDTPNALVEFALLRSDGVQIYNSLIRRRKQINEAFGGSLFWLRDVHSSEHPGTYYALAYTIVCPSLRVLDRESWPTVQLQMIDAMVRLEQAIVPHLQRWLEED